MIKILYINLTNYLPARDRVYLKGLRRNGVEVIEFLDNSPGLKKFLNIYRYHNQAPKDYDFLWVGYSGHILVPLARLMSQKPVIFNALSSLYDGIILSRKQALPFSLKALGVWLTDFLTFHMASLNLIETNYQTEVIAKQFFVPRKKLLRTWTGVDGDEFFYSPAISKRNQFTVVFRGGLLPDSGVEYFAEAAKLLQKENIHFRLMGRGLAASKVQKVLDSYDAGNFEWIQDFLEISNLRKKLQECHLSIGWLSDEPRARGTIEHKTFESLAMKLPYLHARTPGIQELLEENKTCFYCNPEDPKDLAKKILELKNNPALLEKVANNAYELYNRELRQELLAKRLLGQLATSD